MIKKIIYPSYTRLEYSLNSVYIRGLKENGVEVEGLYIKNRRIAGFLKALSFYRKNSKNTDVVMIGYDSPALVTFFRFFYHKKIIYNAVLPVYERLITSRKLASKFSIKAVYYWLLDFLAVHFANLTMVETDHQGDYMAKIFKVSRKKIYRSWIGVGEDRFFYDPSLSKFSTFTVLFRGALLPETGAEYIVKAAKILEKENIKFIMQTGGMLLDNIKNMVQELKPKNFELKYGLLPFEELRILMQRCHISLGQLSDHPRLKRTIPHKAYESLAMKLSYLTASNSGILELLIAGKTCITCKPADADSLAEKILWIKNNYQLAEKIAQNGYELYQNDLRPSLLAKNLLEII